MSKKNAFRADIGNPEYINQLPPRTYGVQKELVSIPDLIDLQKRSFNWFVREGLGTLFKEISPVEDLTGKNLELHFVDYHFDEPKLNEDSARRRNTTYAATLKAKVKLVNKKTGKSKEQEIFLGDIPMMTDNGSFIINGVERVIVSQLVRSSGVLFTRMGNALRNGQYGVKVIPDRGVWLELETNAKGILTVKIDRKRKTYVTTILRILGYSSDLEIKKLFEDVDINDGMKFIDLTLKKDPAKNTDEAYVELYRKVRPGDMVNVENARTLIDNMFFNFRRYDIGRVGRYKINKRLQLNLKDTEDNRVLNKEDFVSIVREVIKLNNSPEMVADDVDHLMNRRVRGVGELAMQSFRTGLLRVERIIKDRMSVQDLDTVTAGILVNARPVTAKMDEFFGSSQLSQFMDQANPLAELEHKRRLSAMGPGGLSRERAGFEVRDVHASHYGRICPIATPEGANIGLVGHLASFARVNDYGFIETPYRKVLQDVPNRVKDLVGHKLAKAVLDPKSRKSVGAAGDLIDEALARKIGALKNVKEVKVKPKVTDEIVYLDAHDDEREIIAQSGVPVDENNNITETKVPVRKFSKPALEFASRVSYADVSSRQILSVGSSLVAFIEHDDAKRASMGTNMQRQAVPLVRPQVPLVATGVEQEAARGSGQIITAPDDGTIESVTGDEIVFKANGRKKTFKLTKFTRSNKETNIHQNPIVDRGQRVSKGEPLTNGQSIVNGTLALGTNLLIAFMPFEGGNFEDAIVLSERLVKEDVLSSIHIHRYEIDVRETKLGPELTTRDIPNVGEEAVRDLDEDGMIRLGAEVHENDILIGKITPKGETDLTPEERLLRAIFGEKVKDVKDTSLRMPHGSHGKVIGIKLFDSDSGDKLDVGIIKRVHIFVAQFRKISVGDKLAGRHGNKGVISRIMPVEDMPFMEDGRPVDVILNPLGVISRMNLGQVLESHLGWAAARLGERAVVPVFDGINMPEIKEEMKKAGLPEDGKIQLFNGKTGQPFEQKTTVGMMYMLKLEHMVDDKIHARSIGPYALVTQQPLGGKAQSGGQRFGEMEVWALEGHGAAYALQEMLTIKSDDVAGRSRTYESIIRGEQIQKPSTPESFNVLVRELRGLGLNVEFFSGNRKFLIDTKKKTVNKGANI